MKNQEKFIAKTSSIIAGVISLAILIRYYVSIKMHMYHIKEDE